MWWRDFSSTGFAWVRFGSGLCSFLANFFSIFFFCFEKNRWKNTYTKNTKSKLEKNTRIKMKMRKREIAWAACKRNKLKGKNSKTSRHFYGFQIQSQGKPICFLRLSVGVFRMQVNENVRMIWTQCVHSTLQNEQRQRDWPEWARAWESEREGEWRL